MAMFGITPIPKPVLTYRQPSLWQQNNVPVVEKPHCIEYASRRQTV